MSEHTYTITATQSQVEIIRDALERGLLPQNP